MLYRRFSCDSGCAAVLVACLSSFLGGCDGSHTTDDDYEVQVRRLAQQLKIESKTVEEALGAVRISIEAFRKSILHEAYPQLQAQVDVIEQLVSSPGTLAVRQGPFVLIAFDEAAWYRDEEEGTIRVEVFSTSKKRDAVIFWFGVGARRCEVLQELEEVEDHNDFTYSIVVYADWKPVGTILEKGTVSSEGVCRVVLPLPAGKYPSTPSVPLPEDATLPVFVGVRDGKLGMSNYVVLQRGAPILQGKTLTTTNGVSKGQLDRLGRIGQASSKGD